MGSSNAGAGLIWFSPGVATAGDSATSAAGFSAGAAGSSPSTTGEWASSRSSSSATAIADMLPPSDALDPNSPIWSRRRIISATGSSTELEWVFFSLTPNSGSISRIVWEGTSNCLASSLMRILLIILQTLCCAASIGPPPSPLWYQIQFLPQAYAQPRLIH